MMRNNESLNQTPRKVSGFTALGGKKPCVNIAKVLREEPTLMFIEIFVPQQYCNNSWGHELPTNNRLSGYHSKERGDWQAQSDPGL